MDINEIVLRIILFSLFIMYLSFCYKERMFNNKHTYIGVVIMLLIGYIVCSN